MAWAKRNASGSWKAMYRDAHGRERSAGSFRTEKLAKTEGVRAEGDARSARGPAARDTLTWGKWCEQWWPSRAIEPSTEKSERSVADKYLNVRWGEVRLKDITRHDVRLWVAELAATPLNDKKDSPAISTGTVRRVVAVFTSSLSAAVEADLLDVNPAAGVKKGPAPRSRKLFLTREQYDLLASKVPRKQDRAVLDFLVSTGARWGELAGLHLHNLDLQSGTVHLVDTLSVGEIKPYPKGRDRHVPVMDWGIENLAIPEKPTPCPVRHRGETHCGSGLVFTNSGGVGPLHPRNFSQRVLAPALEAAGLDLLGVTLHTLRHTYASWLVQGGVPIERVSQLLGHGSIATTQIYAHLAPAQHDDIAAVLGGGRAANGPQTPRIRLLRAVKLDAEKTA